MALPIPSDWDGNTYKYLSVRVPNSTMWRGYIRGRILELTDHWRWDKNTGDGDQAAAAEVAWQIYQTIKLGGVMDLQWIVTLSGTQNVPGGGNDVLYNLNTVEYDPQAQFDLVNHQWICPQPNLYILGGFVQFWDMTGTGDLWARIRTKTNAVYHLTSGNFFASDYNFVQAQFESVCFLNEGDVVNYWVAHSNNSARNTADYSNTQRAWCYRL